MIIILGFVQSSNWIYLIGGVSAANVSVAIVRQSVSLVSVGCAISAIEGALGIGSGQDTDGGQGQFDFGTARHGNGTDGFVNTVPIHRHFNDGALLQVNHIFKFYL